jgi:hypothetical protein
MWLFRRGFSGQIGEWSGWCSTLRKLPYQRSSVVLWEVTLVRLRWYRNKIEPASHRCLAEFPARTERKRTADGDGYRKGVNVGSYSSASRGSAY